MIKLLMDRFEIALADEVVILGRNKRKDLWVQISRIILERMLKDLETGTG
jgi:hypothetical protein